LKSFWQVRVGPFDKIRISNTSLVRKKKGYDKLIDEMKSTVRPTNSVTELPPRISLDGLGGTKFLADIGEIGEI
jgi:hypothetical protein